MKVLMISRSTLYTVPGGDTVQIRETAKALKKQKVEVEIRLANETIDYRGFDLIHFFNVIRPNAIVPHIQKSKLPYVLSTIFVDYREVEEKIKGNTFRLLLKVFGFNGLEYLKTIARWLKNGEHLLDYGYLFRGHRRSVEKVLNGAKRLLPNSESEFQRLNDSYAFQCPYVVVPNAVDEQFLSTQFEGEKREGVICIARIEPIKNQLNLIKAVAGTSIPLKIIGQASPNHQEYFEKCQQAAKENIQFLGQLEKNEVLKVLSQAKVHVLPSWFETTGLSSLEAAAMGCNVVITAKGDTEEYFGKGAFYCKPDNLQSIRETVQEALEAPFVAELRNKVVSAYTWDKAAEQTAIAYQSALEGTKTEKMYSPLNRGKK